MIINTPISLGEVVDKISIFKSESALAKGTMPVLSETLINARLMAPELSDVINFVTRLCYCLGRLTTKALVLGFSKTKVSHNF